MTNYLKAIKIQNFNEDETDNQNSPIIIADIEFIVKNFPKKTKL